jgi:hypothetical protein
VFGSADEAIEGARESMCMDPSYVMEQVAYDRDNLHSPNLAFEGVAGANAELSAKSVGKSDLTTFGGHLGACMTRRPCLHGPYGSGTRYL